MSASCGFFIAFFDRDFSIAVFFYIKNTGATYGTGTDNELCEYDA